jgi:(p)ppGpp synthase/HD superfamily hydrolase
MYNINFWESEFTLCQYSDKLVSLLESLNKQVAKPVNIHEVKKSCYVARKYHGDQLRKSGDPYYSHPLEVGYLFSNYAGIEDAKHYTTDLVITAILHDTIEDTELTKDMIATIFNKSIADKVEDLTRIKFDRKFTAAESVISLFLEHKDDVLHVKLFDRLHNMRTLDAMKPEKQHRIAQETADYFILLPAYLSIKLSKVGEELQNLCSKYLHIQPKLIPTQETKSYLYLG